MKKYLRLVWLPFMLLTMASASNAQIPVTDIFGGIQTTISAMENTAATAKQIQQYSTQLAQYENQLRNSTNPSSFLWDDASYTISQLIRTVDTLNGYKNQVGGLNGYLDKFGSVDTYKDCGASVSCRSKYNDVAVNGSYAQKQANDSMYRGISLQQDQLVTDASNLRRLQQNAEGVGGQLEAIQVANQFASHQSQQLLQVRSLLTQQNAAITARMQTENARESLIQSSDESLLRGNTVQKTTHKGY